MTSAIADLLARVQEAFQPDENGGIGGVVQFDFTGREAGQWYMQIEAGMCSVAPGLHPSPDLTLTADSDDFLDIAGGRLDPMQAFMTGRVRVSGSLALAAKLLERFRLP